VHAADINWGKVEGRGGTDEHRGRETSRGDRKEVIGSEFDYTIIGASRPSLGRFEIAKKLQFLKKPNSNLIVSIRDTCLL